METFSAQAFPFLLSPKIIVTKIITVKIVVINVTLSLLPFPCPFSPMVTEGISLGIIISSLGLLQKITNWAKEEKCVPKILTSQLFLLRLLRLIRDGTGKETGAGLCMFELTDRGEEGWLTYV